MSEHLNNVAKLALSFAAVFDAPKTGELLGKVHDLGRVD